MKSSIFSYRFAAALTGITAIMWLVSAFAHGDMLYFNGFEPGQPGAADFYDSTTGAQGADITVVPSGGGTLHLTPASGNYYAEITNVDDTYSSGYGESVITDYGYQRNGGTFNAMTGQPNGPGVANNGQAFYESTAYYINTGWAAASPNANYAGFWVDTTPYSDPGYLDESNFRVTDTGNGTIGVQLVGYGVGATYPTVTITQSGWYTFKTTFENANGEVANTLSVSDSGGSVLGSAYNDPTAYGSHTPLDWSDLQGTNYGDWTTVWQDGFAGDTLGIDNVEVGTVPEPATLSLLGLGIPLLLKRRRKA
jgi:hypothetical protein